MKRVVVITGGSGGIGFAIAQAFARSGDPVVIFGRREEALRAAALAIGANCSWQRVDVSQRTQVEVAVRATVESRGHIDILISNAGFSRGIPAEPESSRGGLG
jgi:NADP-dependent 3-hydroxy acid dehydrogenase YdfG